MRRRSLYTLIVLGVIVIGIVVLLFREATSGATFRAGEYATLAECVANIPVQWTRGSIEYMGAESACHYLHAGGPPPRR